MTPSLVAGRVQIRPPRTADAEQLGVLNRQLGYATEVQELVARIERLSELDEHFVAVAEVDGTVVGWVQAEQRFSMETGDKAELIGLIVGAAARRSEERRVGKECRSRWSPYHHKKKRKRLAQHNIPVAHMEHARTGTFRARDL